MKTEHTGREGRRVESGGETRALIGRTLGYKTRRELCKSVSPTQAVVDARSEVFGE